MSKKLAPKRNPDWTEEETILALELYLRHRPRYLDENHPEIVELSKDLRLLATVNEVEGTETFRNAAGVSMKLVNLRSSDPTVQAVGLPHGSKVEELAWDKYGSDPIALSIAAGLVRQKIKVPSGLNEQPDADSFRSVSRGPAPYFGSIEHQRFDGENSLYVFRLEGALDRVFSKPIEDDDLVVKIGRSNSIERRLAELNGGFPQELTIRWAKFYDRAFTSAQQAHDIEQALLKLLQEEQFALGKEFALIKPDKLAALIGKAVRC